MHRIAVHLADAFARIDHPIDGATATAAAVIAVAHAAGEVRRVGWRNPRTGVLHQLKMDTHAGPDWQTLWTVGGGG